MLSPEMQGAIDVMRAGAGPLAAVGEHPTRPPLEERRAALEALGQIFPLPDDVERDPVTAAGVPGAWLTPPKADRTRVLLYLHGGAYQSGSSKSHAELSSRLARAAGTSALVIDYRLAPEHPFPAAVDDALAVYRWLLEDQGLAPGAVVLAGDSAGGGLVAATLLAARGIGLDMPAGAAMLSAWTDLTGSGASWRTREDEDPLINVEQLLDAAAEYLGDVDGRNPLASPLFGDLTGLPPLLIDVGTPEVLLDDSLVFARSAKEAGVDVTLEIAEGLPHVYPAIANAPEAIAATDRIGAFLAKQLG